MSKVAFIGAEVAGTKFISFVCFVSTSVFSVHKQFSIREDCGALCGGMRVSSLLFADDTVLLAESAEDMRRSLQCLQSWCEEWSMEINGEKSAMMHMRKRRVDRCAATWCGMDEIPWVSSCKYLGCVIDEFLNRARMVELWVKLGSQALGAWLRRCCESVGEVKADPFYNCCSLWWNQCYCMELRFGAATTS